MRDLDTSRVPLTLANVSASEPVTNPRRMSQAITRRSILIIDSDDPANGSLTETLNSLTEQNQLRASDEDNNDHQRALPDFQQAWEDEYQDSAFQPREMMLVCFVSAAYFLAHFLSTVLAPGAEDDPWLLRIWLPELLCGAQNTLWLLLLCVPALRGACMRLYDPASAYVIFTSYVATIVPAFLREFRSQYRPAAAGAASLTLDYSSFPPNRTCARSPPANATAAAGLGAAGGGGCAEYLLSGTAFVGYLLWNIAPRVCRIGTPYAAAAAPAAAIVLVVLALALGAGGWTVLACAALQLAAGAGAAYFCRVGERVARDKFATIKGTQFAAEQSRDLLLTLVPARRE